MVLFLPIGRKPVVGHIPREISRYTYYFIKHGGSVSATVQSTQRRKSPIEQGRLEILIEVTVKIPKAKENILAVYKTFIARYTKYKSVAKAQRYSSEDETTSAIQVTKKPRLVMVIISSDSDEA